MTGNTEKKESVGWGPGADEAFRLLEGNRIWAEGRVLEDPDVFRRMSEGQAPPYLFVGCADSRKPLDVLTRTTPGQLFIHRNVANLLIPGDPAAEAVLEFALEVLEVRHLVVCGHSGCGGVQAALAGLSKGAVGQWITPLRELAASKEKELEQIPDLRDRMNRLAEINAVAQVENALRSAPVRRRIENPGIPLHFHAWMYQVETGRLRPIPLPDAAWRAAGLLP